MAHVKAKSASHSTSTVKTTSRSKAIANIKAVHKSVTNLPYLGVIVAEFLGTFLITAAFLEMQASPLFFAFAVVGAILLVGGVSGAHLNPAVTIGAWVTRKIDSLTALFYVLAQLLGAYTAYQVLDSFLKNSSTTDTVTGTIFKAATITVGKEWYLFYAELLGSIIIALGFATALRLRKDKVASSLAAGFATMIAFYLTLSITTVFLSAQGTSLTFLNPAIAFAAQGLSLNNWPIVIFVVAPIIGGVIGFVLQDFLQTQNSDNGCDCDCDENCTCCK